MRHVIVIAALAALSLAPLAPATPGSTTCFAWGQPMTGLADGATVEVRSLDDGTVCVLGALLTAQRATDPGYLDDGHPHQPCIPHGEADVVLINDPPYVRIDFHGDLCFVQQQRQY